MAPMVLLAAVALATMTPAPRLPAVAQATATIRIVTGVRLKLDGSANAGAPAARDSTAKSADGTSRAIKVIEFQ
jgi:hypothetical protein